MNLIEELKAKKEASLKVIPEEKLVIMAQSTQNLKNKNISDKALKVGDSVNNFELPNALGNKVRLEDSLSKGSVVISFYRGGWCPYCNIELQALQNLLPEFEKYSTTLIAISPETPDNSLNTVEKNNLSFEVLSDIDNKVAKQMGLVFQLPENLREVYHSFDIDVPKHNGNKDYELPMPATYVINPEGVITYAFIPEDYTERADPKEILNSIK
ncbi:Peroxiredoxin [Tenacibaculum sp. MAR_2009_124]|uniref:peroxiredoxin-like family protein n=1 Tax=Tenacibaculum sp. MAR_2009_124 TaxID=1250059 RepID=UPI000895249D|nr:peroxiredoxin-like family protein [Tenacibaculum sp. MAR_2009_124]SEB36787.1 Peroxiredoxin [Tenacibaculum sp. MAR_2009_124]